MFTGEKFTCPEGEMVVVDIANGNEEKTFIGEEGPLLKKAKKNGDPYTVTPHIQKVQNV